MQTAQPSATQEQRENAYEAFRVLHRPGDPFVIPNPWDIGSALILQGLGFKALATSSAGYAFTLGLKDGQAGRANLLRHSEELVRAVTIPVSADLENCFEPHPDGVKDVIRQAIATGLAGCSIEDATGDPDHPIYDMTEAVERMTAAAEAARAAAPDFVLTGRAENFLHKRPDLDDTIARLKAYEDAGADVLYAPGLTTLEQVREVCHSVTKPVNVLVFGASRHFTVADLAEAGTARISLGSTLSRHIFHAFSQAAKEMADEGTFSFAAHLAGFSDIETHFDRN